MDVTYRKYSRAREKQNLNQSNSILCLFASVLIFQRNGRYEHNGKTTRRLPSSQWQETLLTFFPQAINSYASEHESLSSKKESSSWAMETMYAQGRESLVWRWYVRANGDFGYSLRRFVKYATIAGMWAVLEVLFSSWNCPSSEAVREGIPFWSSTMKHRLRAHGGISK